MFIVTASTAALQRFNTTLQKYIAGSSRTMDEVLEAKGRDLGIRLFKGFRGRQWGGDGLKKNLAVAEMAARTASGKGTKVRSRLLELYRTARAATNSALRSIGQQLRNDRFGGTLDQHATLAHRRDKIRQARARLWRTIVGREIAIRQSSIGALAASFLWFRSRKNSAQGKFYVRNRYNNRPPLGYVEKQPGLLRIVGMTEGLTMIDARYGIVARALNSSELEMRQWMLQRVLAGLGGSAA